MSDATGTDYGDGNVIRPKVFEDSGIRRGGGGLDGGDGGGGDMMLLARVAKLESDVEQIRRDTSSVQTDMKTVLAGNADLRVNVATLLERSQHLATKEWVQLRLAAAFFVLVAAMAGVVGYAPRIQAFFGTSVGSLAPGHDSPPIVMPR